MADTTQPHGGVGELLRMAGPLWQFAPGFVGAVIGLRFVEQLTTLGRATAVGIGLASAVFLGPLLAHFADLFWPGDLPVEARNGVLFLTGLCAMSALPSFLGWVRRVAGDPTILLSFLRPPGSTGAPPPASGDPT